MHALVLDSGKRWGEVAADWQVEDARAFLQPGPDDRLQQWWGRPKGGSKTTDVGGLASVWLAVQAEEMNEGFVVASDRDQAARLLRMAGGLIRRTPGLADLLEVQTYRIVNRANGANVQALAADAAGAEGTLGPIVLVDELPQWPGTKNARDMWTAAYSSIIKWPGMRFVVIGHAGMKGSWQHKVYEQAKAGDLWHVHDVAGPLPWVSPAVLEDQRALLLPSQFRRRHLNEWGDGEDSLTTVDELRACVTLGGPLAPQPGFSYVVAVDLGLSKDRTVGVVAHLEALDGGPVFRSAGGGGGGDDFLDLALRMGALSPSDHWEMVGRSRATSAVPVRVVLDRIQVWQGSRANRVNIDEVESWLLQAHESFNGAPVVLDPWQMVGVSQRLSRRGVKVDEFHFSAQSTGRLASTLHMLLRDGALALPDDEELLDELAHVRLRETSPGVVRMDHDSDRHDDRAVALGLACVHLLNRPAPQRGFVASYESRGLAGTR